MSFFIWLLRVCFIATCLVTGDEGIVMTSPLDTEHPYDIITRSRIDLEEYVLFLQVCECVM